MSSMWSLQVRSSTSVKKSKRVSWPGWYQSKNSSSFFNSVLLNSSAALKPKKKEKQKKEKGTPEVLWSRRNPHNNFTWGYKRLPHNLRQACQNLTKSSTEVQLQWSSLELKAALTKQHDFHVYMDVSLCPIWWWRCPEESQDQGFTAAASPMLQNSSHKSHPWSTQITPHRPQGCLLNSKYVTTSWRANQNPHDDPILSSFLPSFPPKMVTHTPQNPRPSLT